MKKLWIPLAVVLTWSGVACTSDSGKPETDADTYQVDSTTGDADGTVGDTILDTGGDTGVLVDTGPLTECDKPANAARRQALLDAQPSIEGRSKDTITQAITWSSLADDATTTCSVSLDFKDSNDNGALDDYEDWTLTPAERATDLLARMTPAEKMGLMVHPTTTDAPSSSDQAVSAGLQSLITSQNARFGLNTAVAGQVTARATWANNIQELCEGTALGVPFVLSMEPAHSEGNGREKSAGFSKWPHELGLAATGDPAKVEGFGQVVSQELRAIGVRMALSVPADLATDPRWYPSQFTFGEDSGAVADMVAAYLKGLQGEALGQESVAAVVSHFPGGGASTGGWDGRLAKGKHLSYTGTNIDAHMAAFAKAFDGGVAGVMPAYGVPETGSWTGLGGTLDGTSIDQVGASFNSAIITDALRDHFQFDGLVLAPWGVLDDAGGAALGAPWGVESMTKAQRLAAAVNAGVDQFGGLDTTAPIADAKTASLITDAEIDRAAGHALSLMFALGLFEDPYIDAAQAPALVNTDTSYRAGLDAMNRSMVLLLNKNKPSGWLDGDGDGTQLGDKGNAGNGTLKVLPAPPGEPYVHAGCSYFIMGSFDLDYIRSVSTGYGELTNDATEIAGVAVTTAAERIANSNYVFIRIDAPYSADPDSGALHYSKASLEYATNDNADQLDDLAFARNAIDGLATSQTQIIVIVDGGRPSVVSEIMSYNPSGLFYAWSVTDKIVLDVAFGIVDGVGKLPVGLPASDVAAAAQSEDVAGDGQHATFVAGFGLTTSAF
ncbi:MAG: hypothetical protein CVU56_01605 [Deltaproteobacteria bacterium HGW-Deltaproteobacteria-14]|jgi:beta-glucosidase|nr:MAG: hypothetical protein CVU56_01605 [Deltaproteobacteria bacterium HGW-Deltaproteobacteria-14]